MYYILLISNRFTTSNLSGGQRLQILSIPTRITTSKINLLRGYKRKILSTPLVLLVVMLKTSQQLTNQETAFAVERIYFHRNYYK